MKSYRHIIIFLFTSLILISCNESASSKIKSDNQNKTQVQQSYAEITFDRIFHDFGTIKDIPVGTCATAYNDPEFGKTYILLFGESLYFGDRLTHSLLCPNQIQANGNVVEDTPRQFDEKSRHGMVLQIINTEGELFIPFTLNGIISVIEGTRKPTKEELEE